MKVLVVDVGGTHVKILATGCTVERRMDSGPRMTAEEMVAGVHALAREWKYDAVAIGYPGPVVRNRPAREPCNLGTGWVDLDYEAAFGCPVRIVNDAAMQALGSYKGGKMLFLGLGTAWAPRWSSTASSCRWSSRTCPTGRQRSRTTSECKRSSATERRSGEATWRT